MRNPFRRRRPIPNAATAAALRLFVYEVKHIAVRQVVLSRMLGIDDLMIISHAQGVAEGVRDADPRGARMLAREVSRLIHANPSEGNPL